MNRINIAVTLLSVIAISDCHEKSAPEPSAEAKVMSEEPQRTVGLDPGWVLASAATYTASQTPGEVIIKARGENPTAGYEVKLVQSPLRIWPPQYMLASKKPDGMAAQVVTPFEVSASIKSTDPIHEIVVTDAAGRHEVKVAQPRD